MGRRKKRPLPVRPGWFVLLEADGDGGEYFSALTDAIERRGGLGEDCCLSMLLGGTMKGVEYLKDGWHYVVLISVF